MVVNGTQQDISTGSEDSCERGVPYIMIWGSKYEEFYEDARGKGSRNRYW